MKKTPIAILLALLLGCALFCTAQACTGIYVGADVSEDGTVLIAKSNDYQDVWPNYVTVTPREENAPGRVMPVDNGRTVFAPIPASTWRYTSTPWMDSTTAANGLGKDATVCANECGVSMIMSITAFANNEAMAADPMVVNGLTEFTAVDLVVCQSATAREAVGVLCGLLDSYGSSENNIAFIADRSEVWYVEMYTGHQYAAVRLPSDRVCVFGNEFSLEYLSEYEDSVTSAGLESTAAEHGFAFYGPNGELNLYETYSGSRISQSYSHMRTWIGHRALAPSVYGEDYDPAAFYPLCFTPDRRVSLSDVMSLTRNRFEGTPYQPDETGRTDMRVIGTDTALSVHILQIYPDLPAGMCTVTWESAAPSLYGVFVPVSNAMTEISGAYGRNQGAQVQRSFDTSVYPWYAFKALNTLCVGRDAWQIYGMPVREYWGRAEAVMTEGMKTVLARAAGSESAEASAILEAYCTKVQEAAFEDAGTLLNDILWTMSKNSNTMKNGRNPETHEVLDCRVTVPPMEVTLDTAHYLP